MIIIIISHFSLSKAIFQYCRDSLSRLSKVSETVLQYICENYIIHKKNLT